MNNLYARGGKRLLDILRGVIIAAPVAPLIALFMLFPGIHLVVKARIGRQGKRFTEYRLRCPPDAFGRMLERISFHRMPAIWNILRGDMSFVGPRALKPDEAMPSDGQSHPRFSVRPGLISPWWLRVRSNMTFDREFDVDADYARTVSLKHDLSITLRAALAFAYGKDETENEQPLELLGVHIASRTTAEAIDDIVRIVQEGRRASIPSCFSDLKKPVRGRFLN
ncbi:MAG: sugar transferase [Kiritimatiellaceae bacterium]|nr:sugar transferase [Kiritimatiellaceae bacterium]